MEIIYALLAAIVCVLGAGVLASVAVNVPNWKYYKKVYKTLPNSTFYLCNGIIVRHKWNQKDDGFVWFRKDNHPCLQDGVYLHDAFFTYLCPYSFYWLIKYKRWFKVNVDASKLEDYHSA